MNMPLLTPAIQIQDAGDDVLVHDPVRHKVHVLNQTAGAVLRGCDGKTPVRSVAEGFDVSRADEIERDIVNVIREFAQLGLVGS